MDCKNARLLLEFTHPGSAELDAAEKEALHQHLAECPDCAAQAREERRADEHLGRAVRDVPVPAGLRERVLKRLTVERDAAYRRLIVRGVAAAAALLLAGWLGYVWWSNQLPAITSNTINQLADWKRSRTREDVIKGFKDDYGIAVNPPDQFKYNLLDSYNLEVLPKMDRPVPHLLFVSTGEPGGRKEAHVYVLSNRQFDLQETMTNIGTLSGRGRYTPWVYFNESRDTLYVVMYSSGILFEDVFLMKANG
jgi:hypothetical protein